MEATNLNKKIIATAITFGKRVKQVREEKGMATTELVRLCNVNKDKGEITLSRGGLYNYEKNAQLSPDTPVGEFSLPKISTAIRIADALGVDASWLLGMNEPESQGNTVKYTQVTLSRKQLNAYNKFLSLTEEHRDAIQKIAHLPQEQQDMLLKMIKAL